MRLPTTLTLVVLAGACAAVYFVGPRLPWEQPATAPSGANGARELLAKLTPDQITKAVLRRDGQEPTIFERKAGGWVTNGNWPGNAADVEPVIHLLGSLSSRFQAEQGEATPKAGPELTVELTTRDGGRQVLKLSELPRGDYRFVRPTYLRVEGHPEVLRLAPGLVGELSRPPDQFRQRRIFPAERTAKANNPQERLERLDARELVVTQENGTSIRLVKGKDSWELSAPSRDHLDPDAGEKLLAAVADLWAEQFVKTDPAAAALALVPPTNPLVTISELEALSPAAALQRAGLDRAKQSLRVTRHDGTVTTLVLGNRSRGETPPPIPPRPGAPPPAPESYRFARLEGSDVIFEVQDGRLNDVFVSFEQLRDNRLARFNSDDAEEIEIRQGKQVAKLVKEKKDSWRMLSPRATQADNDKVRDLLQKLSALEAADKDVLSPTRQAEIAATVTASLDRASLAGLCVAAEGVRLSNPTKAFNLGDDSTRVEVVVREKARSEDRDRSKERKLSLRVGKPAGEAKRVYLRLDGWPRIDAMEDSLSALLDRPATSYRGKQVFDFAAKEVGKLEIRHVALPASRPALGGLVGTASTIVAERTPDVVLQRSGDEWTLTTPLSTTADAAKVNDLLDAIGKIKALGFVADDVPAADMQKDYGLGVPALRVTMTFADPTKPPRTVDVGAGRGGEPGYFARVDDSKDVFALPGDLRDRLEQSALAYLPSTLWQVASDDEITRFRIAKAGQDEYQLNRKGAGWEVTGPFTVAAPTDVVERLSTAMQSPRAEEYRSFAAGDLKAYGLDAPAVKVTLTTKKGKEHTLAVGAVSSGGKPGRYARLNSGGVFVVGDALAKAADQSALDFLNRDLLDFDSAAVTAVSRQGTDALELVKQDDAWKLTKPTEQPGDERKVPELLRQLSSLKAERIVAYKPKDLKPYGLDKPYATVTVKLGGDKPTERVLLLGREEGGGRVAMVKDGQAVAVLPANVVKQLLAGAITFRDHDLARIPDADAMKLEAGERKVTFARPEGTWKLTQPIAGDADHDALEGYFNALSRLRADELVAEKPTPEQLKGYGLEKPTAKWQVFNGDEQKLDLIIGGTGSGGRRYARLGDKGLVFLLDEKLSGLATAEYRPRTLWKEALDPAQVESVRFGYKTEPFELKKDGGDWKAVGKPDAKLNSATVSDTLSALRDLKLERYVKDDGAQLKLYGLEPPELVLEVTTPSGKQTLEIGGVEGGTKKRYARLPTSKRKDAFVLDEAASAKLFRDLAALGKAVAGEGKAKEF